MLFQRSIAPWWPLFRRRRKNNTKGKVGENGKIYNNKTIFFRFGPALQFCLKLMTFVPNLIENYIYSNGKIIPTKVRKLEQL